MSFMQRSHSSQWWSPEWSQASDLVSWTCALSPRLPSVRTQVSLQSGARPLAGGLQRLGPGRLLAKGSAVSCARSRGHRSRTCCTSGVSGRGTASAHACPCVAWRGPVGINYTCKALGQPWGRGAGGGTGRGAARL